MYSHIIGMDEELRDILEEGVCNLRLDEKGVALDRKAHTTEQKKLYNQKYVRLFGQQCMIIVNS